MSKKRIVITGCNGLLGHALVRNLRNPHTVLATAKSINPPLLDGVDYRELDITQTEHCKAIIHEFKPDVIINAAAYTHVDRCESDRENCWQVNVRGVENLARAARKNMAQLIHLSTDYIFDGENGPYGEDDPPNPLGYYGKAKLASENALRKAGIPYAIVRTNVIYGAGESVKNNFFLWLYNSLKDSKTVTIVTDQWNNPIESNDLAQGIALMVEGAHYGVYHLGGPEYLSRYEFALQVADTFGFSADLIKPILTADLGQAAPRPLKGGLKIDKAKTDFNFSPRNTEEIIRFYQKMEILD